MLQTEIVTVLTEKNRPKHHLITAFWFQSQPPVFIALFLSEERQEQNSKGS